MSLEVASGSPVISHGPPARKPQFASGIGTGEVLLEWAGNETDITFEALCCRLHTPSFLFRILRPSFCTA
jgi:hypothetical protein